MSQLIVRLTYMGTFFVTPLLAENWFTANLYENLNWLTYQS